MAKVKSKTETEEKTAVRKDIRKNREALELKLVTMAQQLSHNIDFIAI